MKFKNKQTQEMVEVSGYTLENAYIHNSNWEKVEEVAQEKKNKKK